MQCFPDGTDMTAVLDFYFQVRTEITFISESLSDWIIRVMNLLQSILGLPSKMLTL